MLAFRALPAIIKASQRKQLAVRSVKEVRSLDDDTLRRDKVFPLVEPLHHDDAALTGHEVLVGGLLRQRLRTGVDRLVLALVSRLRPEGNEAPASVHREEDMN